MEIMVVPDGHYYRDPNGSVYVESVYNYDFFKRYLSVYNKVYVVGRITSLQSIPNNMKLASGNNVEFLELPAYKGPWGYVKNYWKIRNLAKDYSKRFNCAIFRVPGATANIMCKEFALTKKPFAVEVVVDPWEYFSKGSVQSITRPLVRRIWTNFLKRICKKANGVSYVTKNYLQKKYPSYSIINGESNYYFDSNYSSVSLNANSFGEPKKYHGKSKFTISHVANAFVSYGKGHVTLMNALKIVRNKGYDVDIVFIGDGPLKSEFIKMSKSFGIDKYVTFTGRLPDGDAVRELISNSDLFVFPSMAEGLPRVVLEAMSVGLPCISSPVTGIPEILPSEYLVDHKDHEGYANKIIELIQDTERLEEASERNIEVAGNFTEEKLNAKRKKFYKRLKKLTLEENTLN
ncbi:glycosyltransferase family 4 protein [Halobacillus yeomjeoni]|uniref:glycosyltransferase family 4 protein n=1 Tax=Halobacillus yeomjeoni TaxID=311194 RepID=UPI001CD6287F|nr:glycosyltransferase family 4 protein [Halobacillus yeomjeoni]MCA0985182.1 glycosyltransferase family 4 protein [Halobacillus yeomjeoni]